MGHDIDPPGHGDESYRSGPIGTPSSTNTNGRSRDECQEAQSCDELDDWCRRSGYRRLSDRGAQRFAVGAVRQDRLMITRIIRG